MARFRQTVVLEPVSRAWFDQAVDLAFDTLTEYLAGVGDPPAAETQYELPDSVTTVHLESWGRAETAIRGWGVDDDSATVWTARLDSPANPRTAELSGDFRGTERGIGWLSATSWTARLDLSTWWDGTARKGVGPAVTARVRQRLVQGGGTIAVAPAPGGRWKVTVRVTLNGRGLLRPLGAVAMLFARVRVNRQFRKVMTEFAQLWNKEVPRLRTMNQDELRELITKELTEATP